MKQLLEDYDKLRAHHGSQRVKLISPAAARANAPKLNFDQLPKPAFTGVRVIETGSLAEIAAFFEQQRQLIKALPYDSDVIDTFEVTPTEVGMGERVLRVHVLATAALEHELHFQVRLAEQGLNLKRGVEALRNSADLPQLPVRRFQRKPLPFGWMQTPGDTANLLERVRG